MKLEGSKDLISEIDKIEKKLKNALGASQAQVDTTGLNSLKNASNDLKDITFATLIFFYYLALG
jgi:Trp operon repressor